VTGNYTSLALGGLLILLASATSAQDYGGLKEGEGREETFGNCTACHSAMLVRQQSHDRRTWNEIIDWMIDYHGMWELDEDTRNTIVDYLVKHYGPES